MKSGKWKEGQEIGPVLDRVSEADIPDKKDLEFLLSTEDQQEVKQIFDYADGVRRQYVGDGIFIRGIVEFSNVCSNKCAYCGINRDNSSVKRFTMSGEEVLAQVSLMASQKIKTVVLQSGEDEGLDPEWLAGVVRSIKRRFDIAVTLSVGEKPFDQYRLWREAGADRYLLKIETTNKDLYDALHPGMSFENRLRCLSDLKLLGYETGSGNIIGLKGQTLSDIAEDILFFKKTDFDMIGIGPFIPHKDTPLGDQSLGRVPMVLKTIALTRIITKNTNIPATTALGSADGDHRIEGLKAGANVLMPNYTPPGTRSLYEIYPGKRCLTEESGACLRCYDTMAVSIGRYIDYSAGDRLEYIREGIAA